MPIGMSRSVSATVPAAARAPRLDTAAARMPRDDRADDLEQRPDRGDADRAGADEAHLVAERGGHDVATTSAPRRQVAPTSASARSTPQLISRPTSMAMPTAMPTRWPTPISAIDRLAEQRSPRRRRPGRLRDTSSPTSLSRGEQREAGRDDRAEHDRAQARAGSPRRPPTLRGADLEHFGRGDAFGIGQVRAGHQRAAQRHRIHHAQDAADRDHRDRQPVGEALSTSRP